MSTMPATEAAPVPAEVPGRPRRSRRLLLVAAALLVVAVGAAAYLLLLAPAGDGSQDAAAPEPVVTEGAVVEVGTLTTNLAGSPARYARVGIGLVLSEGVAAATVESRFALVKDAAITEIGRHDAVSLQSGDGTEQLRRGLAERIKALYPDGEVLRVVLTELLVQ